MKWEYLITDVRRYAESSEMSDGYYSGLDDQELNRLGSDGWEMVEARKDGEQAVFKRPLPEPIAQPSRATEPPPADVMVPSVNHCDHQIEPGRWCDKPITHHCVCRRCSRDDEFFACAEHAITDHVVRYRHQSTYPAHDMVLERIYGR